MDFVVAGPTAVLDTVHSTGLPYCVAIPVTAVLVRTTLVYYLSTRPQRRQVQALNDILPLLEAKTYVARHSPRRAHIRHAIQRGTPLEQIAAKVEHMFFQLYESWRIRSKLRKVFAAGYRPWPFLNFGILIAFTESIRLKCGRDGGLLSYLFSPPTGAASESSPPSAAEALAARLQAARDAMVAKSQGGEVIDSSSTPITLPPSVVEAAQETQDATLNATNTPGPYFDPAMQIEGFEFCTDLTQLDPTSTLNLTAAAIILGTAYFKPALSARAKARTLRTGNHNQPTGVTELAERAKSRKIIPQLTPMQAFSMSIAFLFALAMQVFPAAIVLYIAPNILAGWVQNRYLDIKDPIRPGIRHCAKPLVARSSKTLL